MVQKKNSDYDELNQVVREHSMTQLSGHEVTQVDSSTVFINDNGGPKFPAINSRFQNTEKAQYATTELVEPQIINSNNSNSHDPMQPEFSIDEPVFKQRKASKIAPFGGVQPTSLLSVADDTKSILERNNPEQSSSSKPGQRKRSKEAKIGELSKSKIGGSNNQSMMRFLKSQDKLRTSLQSVVMTSQAKMRAKRDDSSDDEVDTDQGYDFKHIAQTNSSQELLKNMSFTIDTQKLYSVVSTCNFNESNRYCPVLLQVNDNNLQELYGGQYVVQVWSNNKAMVFERVYQRPVNSWCLSGNMLVYLEDLDRQELASDDDVIQDGNVFGVNNAQLDQVYSIVDLSTASGNVSMIRVVITGDGTESTESESIIGFYENRLIIASSSYFRYIDVKEHLSNVQESEKPLAIQLNGLNRPEIIPNVKTFKVNHSELKEVKMGPQWQIKGMHETVKEQACDSLVNDGGHADMCLICEDLNTNILTYFQISELLEHKAVFLPIVKGLDTNQSADMLSNHEIDNVINYKSLITWNQSSQSFMQVGIALRQSGGIDFYFNYRLVEKVAAEENSIVYTAIDADYNSLKFKCLKTQADGELVLSSYECPTTWNQRIGLHSSTEVNIEKMPQVKQRLRSYFDQMSKTSMIIKRDKINTDDFDHLDTLILIDSNWFNEGLGERVTQYMKLFSSFINLGRRFILAHNRFVSVFNLSKKTWSSHEKFQDLVRQIFRHRIIDQEEIRIGVLSGLRTFNFFNVSSLGKISLSSEVITASGHVVDFLVDQINDTGFYFLQMSGNQDGRTSQIGGAASRYKHERAVSLSELNFLDSKEKFMGATTLNVLVASLINEITPRFMKREQNYECQMGIEQTGKEIETDENQSFKSELILDLRRASSEGQLTKRRLRRLVLQFNGNKVSIEQEKGSTAIQQQVINDQCQESGGETRGPERFIGQIVKDDKLIYFTNKHIIMMDDSGQVERVFENRNLCNLIFVDETWIYALKNSSMGYDNKKKSSGGSMQAPGFYIYDVMRMLEGNIEIHKLENVLGGAQDFIDFDFDTQTVAYVKDFTQILLMPLAHRNTLKFFGMGKKQDYLIWRQQDGIFTAVDKKLKITMWSTVSGKILQQQGTEAEADKDKDPHSPLMSEPDEPSIKNRISDQMQGRIARALSDSVDQKKQLVDQIETKNAKKFQVYRANSSDNTYLMDWNNKGEFSFSLVFAPESKIIKINEDEKNTDNRQHNPFVGEFGQIQSGQSIAEGKFQFKVLQLSDTLSQNKSMNNVSQISINFGKSGDHKLLTWKEKLNFMLEIPLNPENRPYIYLNKELNRMVVKRPQNFSAQIYQHEGAKANKKVKWQLLYNINRFPMMLQGDSSANFLFSPSFEKFIDINYSENTFIIRESKSQNVVSVIPDGLISISFKSQNKTNDAIKAMASRIMFHSETHVRIISKEGLDCILDFKTLELQSFAQIDNFDMNNFRHPHAILENELIQTHKISERLMRKVNEIKLTRSHLKGELNQRNRQAKERGEPELSEQEIQDKILEKTYQTMFSVDYSQPDCFAIELSFTILDMKILERIVKDKTYDFSNVCEDQRLQMCFNIFPTVSSVFHTLAINANVCDYRVIQDIFDSAKEGLQRFEGKSVTIPIFRNKWNKTAIDDCLDENKYMNIKLASFLFKNITNYPMMHSSFLLTEATIKAIEYDIPGIVEFIEGRLIKSPHLSVERMETSALIKSKTNTTNGRQYACDEFQIWESKKTIANELFDPKGFAKKLKLCFFDIPCINDMSHTSDEFFETLANSDNLSLFKLTSIQIIITKAWNEHKAFFIIFLFGPFFTLVTCFTAWSLFLDHNNVYGNPDLTPEDRESFNFWHTVLISGIFGSSFVIVMQELYQMIKYPREYFGDIWNYFDLIPLFFSCVGPFINIFYLHSDDRLDYTEEEIMDLNNRKARTKMVASLLLWLKLLYFLRIYNKLSYLIKMFFEVIFTIIPFMIMFTIFIIAFSTANFAILELSEEPLYDSWQYGIYYSYLQALGLTEVSDLEETYLQGLFVFSTILNLIVMLNLLIAIIGDTYNIVSQTQEEYAFKELCSVIADCRDFPLWRLWVKQRKPCSFMFVAITEDVLVSEKEKIYIQDVYEQVMSTQNQIKELAESVVDLTKEVDQINNEPEDNLSDNDGNEGEPMVDNADHGSIETLINETLSVTPGLAVNQRANLAGNRDSANSVNFD